MFKQVIYLHYFWSGRERVKGVAFPGRPSGIRRANTLAIQMVCKVEFRAWGNHPTVRHV